VTRLLREPVFVHLATVNDDGSPQSTPVWVDTDGREVILNTAKGRVKYENMRRNPSVAVSLVNPENPYEMVEIRGEARLEDEGADDHIDSLAKKYLGKDTYPFRRPGEQRVVVRVRPTKVIGM
jgi:PPOX class probable F420-dependent enzyme